MFGLFKKKSTDEQVVNFDDLKATTTEEVIDIKNKEIEVLKKEQQAKDAEQDKLVKEMQNKIANLTKQVRELKTSDAIIAKSDFNQNEILKDLSYNYMVVKKKVEAFDIKTQITVKNANEIKSKLMRIIDKLEAPEKDTIKDINAILDKIIKRHS